MYGYFCRPTEFFKICKTTSYLGVICRWPSGTSVYISAVFERGKWVQMPCLYIPCCECELTRVNLSPSIPSVGSPHYGIDIWLEVRIDIWRELKGTMTTTTIISPGLLYSSRFSSETWILKLLKLRCSSCKFRSHSQSLVKLICCCQLA